MMQGKKGQVAIFVIIAVVIIAGFAFYFLSRSNVIPEIPGLSDGKETNPSSFLDSCLEEKLETTIETLMHQGGYLGSALEPTFNRTFMFVEEGVSYDITYLCYFGLYYEKCINQKPNLMQDIKTQIKDEINDDVQRCWDDLTSSLEKEGYSVNEKYNGFEVELGPEKVVVNIDGELTLRKASETAIRDDFSVIFPTRLYELAVVAKEIVNQESRFCNFEYQGYMVEFPDFNIDKSPISDSAMIYTVKHTKTNEWFRFAIRGCVISPGF